MSSDSEEEVSAYESLLQEHNELNEANQRLKSEILKMKASDYGRLKEKYDNLRDKYDVIKEENRDLKIELVALKRKLRRQETEHSLYVRSQNREIKKLEKKYDNVKKDITKTTSRLNAQLASTTLDLKNSNQQVKDLIQKYKRAPAKSKTLPPLAAKNESQIKLLETEEEETQKVEVAVLGALSRAVDQVQGSAVEVAQLASTANEPISTTEQQIVAYYGQGSWCKYVLLQNNCVLYYALEEKCVVFTTSPLTNDNTYFKILGYIKTDVSIVDAKLKELSKLPLDTLIYKMEPDDKELTLGVVDAPAKLIFPAIVRPESNSGQQKSNASPSAPSSSLPPPPSDSKSNNGRKGLEVNLPPSNPNPNPSQFVVSPPSNPKSKNVSPKKVTVSKDKTPNKKPPVNVPVDINVEFEVERKKANAQDVIRFGIKKDDIVYLKKLKWLKYGKKDVTRDVTDVDINKLIGKNRITDKFGFDFEPIPEMDVYQTETQFIAEYTRYFRKRCSVAVTDGTVDYRNYIKNFKPTEEWTRGVLTFKMASNTDILVLPALCEYPCVLQGLDDKWIKYLRNPLENEFEEVKESQAPKTISKPPLEESTEEFQARIQRDKRNEALRLNPGDGGSNPETREPQSKTEEEKRPTTRYDDAEIIPDFPKSEEEVKQEKLINEGIKPLSVDWVWNNDKYVYDSATDTLKKNDNIVTKPFISNRYWIETDFIELGFETPEKKKERERTEERKKQSTEWVDDNGGKCVYDGVTDVFRRNGNMVVKPANKKTYWDKTDFIIYGYKEQKESLSTNGKKKDDNDPNEEISERVQLRMKRSCEWVTDGNKYVYDGYADILWCDGVRMHKKPGREFSDWSETDLNGYKREKEQLIKYEDDNTPMRKFDVEFKLSDEWTTKEGDKYVYDGITDILLKNNKFINKQSISGFRWTVVDFVRKFQYPMILPSMFSPEMKNSHDFEWDYKGVHYISERGKLTKDGMNIEPTLAKFWTKDEMIELHGLDRDGDNLTCVGDDEVVWMDKVGDILSYKKKINLLVRNNELVSSFDDENLTKSYDYGWARQRLPLNQFQRNYSIPPPPRRNRQSINKTDTELDIDNLPGL